MKESKRLNEKRHKSLLGSLSAVYYRSQIKGALRMSVAGQPLTIRKTVPSEYLKVDGGLSPNLLMLLVSVVLIATSTVGYFL